MVLILANPSIEIKPIDQSTNSRKEIKLNHQSQCKLFHSVEPKKGIENTKLNQYLLGWVQVESQAVVQDNTPL